MSIDEKRLEQMEFDGGGAETAWSGVEERELFRLARLGLWAEQHAVPALRLSAAKAMNNGGIWVGEVAAKAAANALAALPKETT